MKKISKAILHKIAEAGDNAGFRLTQRREDAGLMQKKIADLLMLPRDYLVIRQQFQGVFGRSPNILRPKTFNEYLQSQKILGRKPHHEICADKLKARELAKNKIGEDLFPHVYWQGTNITEANLDGLPSRFVIKTNHSWRTVIKINDKSRWDPGDNQEVVREWLRSNFSFKHREYQYRWIKPRVYIEQLIEKPDGSEPDEYNFFCFHGKVKLIEVHKSRFSEHRRATVTRDFRRLNINRKGHSTLNEEMAMPEEWAMMVYVAEALSSKEVFVRVDFMYGQKPWLAELTFTPGAGQLPFVPASADRALGTMLRDNSHDLEEYVVPSGVCQA